MNTPAAQPTPAEIIRITTRAFAAKILLGETPESVLLWCRDSFVAIGCERVAAMNLARAISISLAEPTSVSDDYRAGVHAALVAAA